MSIFIISQRKNDVGSVENENITFLNFTAFLFLEVHFASFEKRGSYIFSKEIKTYQRLTFPLMLLLERSSSGSRSGSTLECQNIKAFWNPSLQKPKFFGSSEVLDALVKGEWTSSCSTEESNSF